MIDTEIEKKIIQGYVSGQPGPLFNLIIACDLQRSQKHEELERFIVLLYARLYMEKMEPLLVPGKMFAGKEVKLRNRIMQRALAMTKVAGSQKAEEPKETNLSSTVDIEEKS